MRELFNKKGAFKQKTNPEKSDLEQKATFDNDEVTENLLNNDRESEIVDKNSNQDSNENYTDRENRNNVARPVEETEFDDKKRVYPKRSSGVFTGFLKQAAMRYIGVFIVLGVLSLISYFFFPGLYYQLMGKDSYTINDDGKAVYVDEATYSVNSHLSDYKNAKTAFQNNEITRDEFVEKLTSLVSSVRETRGKIPKDTSDSLSIVQREALARIEALAGGLLAIADRNNLNTLDPDVKEELVALYPEGSALTDEITERINKANVDNGDRAVELNTKLIEYYE